MSPPQNPFNVLYPNIFMSILSRAEVQYLQGARQVSKSYEYKLKSIIKKKIATLLENELPLLSQLFPNLDLTKFSKSLDSDKELDDLTKIGKVKSENHDFIDINKMLDFIPQESINDHKKPCKSILIDKNEQLYIKSKKKFNNYNTRAGGLAWLRYRLDMAGVVGSNPTRPTLESKVFLIE